MLFSKQSSFTQQLSNLPTFIAGKQALVRCQTQKLWLAVLALASVPTSSMVPPTAANAQTANQASSVYHFVKVLVALLVLAVAGCGDNPGKWPKEKVAEHVKESLIGQKMDMSDVTLTEKVGGGFEGTGTVAGGETLSLTITQDADNHRLIWEAKGDRGSFLDGSYQLK